MIIEQTRMIGILKALGAKNGQIQKIFIINGLCLTKKGMIMGNLIGIGTGFLQKNLKILPLNPETYYMDTVPIQMDYINILFINLFTFLLILGTLFIPTLIISAITPIKSIKI